MSEQQRPNQLFDALLEDLSRVRPSTREEILCPLCLESFGRDAIASKLLSEEHMIPGSVGGRAVTLSCTKCNNEDGTQIDSHLAQKLRMDDALQGYGTMPMAIEIAGNKMTTDVEWKFGEGENTVVQVIGKASNPSAWPAAKEALRQENHPIHMTANFGYSLQRSKLALVRIAYLSMFHHFGYRYILSEPAETIRGLIRSRRDDTKLLARMVLGISNVSYDPGIPVIIVPVERGANTPHYLLIIRLVGARIKYESVIMPAPISGGEAIYDELKAISGQSPSVSIEFQLPAQVDQGSPIS